MDNRWNRRDEETIGMLNGHCVMNALASQKNEITEDELLERFIKSTDELEDLVENELKRILCSGVASGFILKTGSRYALPSLENVYEADCDEGGDTKDIKMELTIKSPGRYTTLSFL